MYIRAAFADGVTGRIEARYSVGGINAETTMLLESGSTHAAEMKQFFWVANGRDGDKIITVTATADDGREQVFTVEVYMEPWILRAGVTSGGLMQTLAMENGKRNFTVEVPTGADSAELILVPFDTSNDYRGLNASLLRSTGTSRRLSPATAASSACRLTRRTTQRIPRISPPGGARPSIRSRSRTRTSRRVRRS